MKITFEFVVLLCGFFLAMFGVVQIVMDFVLGSMINPGYFLAGSVVSGVTYLATGGRT